MSDKDMLTRFHRLSPDDQKAVYHLIVNLEKAHQKEVAPSKIVPFQSSKSTKRA